MIEMVDSKGSIIKGHLRSDSGAIVVDDAEAFSKYKRAKELETTVQSQAVEIQELKSMINNILSMLKEGK